MIEQTSEMSRIEQRLGKLERENRRLRMTGVVAAVAVFGIITMGQARPKRAILTADMVVADRFVVKDPTGNTRAELGMFCYDGPCLRFLGTDGTVLASATSTSFNLLKGQVAVPKDFSDSSKGVQFVDGPEVSLSQSGLIVMTSEDARQKHQVFVSFHWAPQPNSPSLSLFSSSAKNGNHSTVNIAAEADGPAITLDDSDFSAVLGSNPLIYPRTGETIQTSAASLVLFGKGKKVLWAAP